MFYGQKYSIISSLLLQLFTSNLAFNQSFGSGDESSRIRSDTRIRIQNLFKAHIYDYDFSLLEVGIRILSIYLYAIRIQTEYLHKLLM